MYQKVKAYIQKYRMLRMQDRVVTGVSGGPDSICLLFVLKELQKELDLSILAVHVHHGIRGACADADEKFVETVCREWGVEFRSVHRRVPEYAREHGQSVEEAGRNIRRAVFEEICREWEGTRIALAHHRDDNAETLIWNLCRGCGLRGLGGIAPVEGRYIRPLLCAGKREIESYLGKRGISYCTDETNLEDHYTRNRIRNRVIPYLEREVNARSVDHMSDTMEQMRELCAYIEGEMARYEKFCVEYPAQPALRACIRSEKYEEVPPALRRYLLREVLCRLAGRRKDIEEIHEQLLEELFGKQTGRMLDLPYGMHARRCYEGIEIWRGEAAKEPEERRPVLRKRVFGRPEGPLRFPVTPYTKWFDYDIIKNTVKIRHREPGDYIVIDSRGGRQKLKQYFINNKIPQEERDRIWLAADGNEILWIIGGRQSQAYQVSDRTRRILEIEICGGKEDGRTSQSDDPGSRSGKADRGDREEDQ